MENRTQNALVGVLLSITLIFVSGCGKKDDSTTDKSDKLVKTFSASAEGATVERVISGVVQEKSSAKLAFRIAGPIKTIIVSEGDFVKKGALLAKIDPRDYQLKVDVTKAQYNQVVGEVARIKKLYENNRVSENDYEKATSGLEMLTVKYEADKNSLADTRLVAPFSGFVQEIFFDESELVNQGMPVVTLISESLEIEADIPNDLYLQKESVDSIVGIIGSTSGKRYHIKLLNVRHKASNNLLHHALFSLNPEDRTEISSGQSVHISIYLHENQNAPLAVPVTALWEKDGTSYVWLVKESKARAISVSVEKISRDGMAHVSSGISANDVVIIAGVHSLNEGETVKSVAKISDTNVGGLL
jgi:RND family efflux transporter MFP subunit